MTESSNPKARYIHHEYPHLSVRYATRHEECRFWLSVGPRNGLITGFSPDNPRITV